MRGVKGNERKHRKGQSYIPRKNERGKRGNRRRKNNNRKSKLLLPSCQKNSTLEMKKMFTVKINTKSVYNSHGINGSDEQPDVIHESPYKSFVTIWFSFFRQ